MTTQHPKQSINWYYFIVGLILLLFSFYPSPTVSALKLSTGSITLNRQAEWIKGASKSPSFHRLWSNEYKAAFIIQEPGEVAAGFEQLDSLKKGDSLEIQYLTPDRENLNNPSKEIPVYALSVNRHLLFSIHHYDTTYIAIERRRTILILLVSALLILRGLSLINSKATYIIGGIAIAAILILRYFHKF